MADDKVQEYDSYPADHDYKKQVMADELTGAQDSSPSTQSGRSFVGSGNDVSGYYGVDKEYQNYANETEKPYLSEGGPERFFEDMAHGVVESDDPEDKKEEVKKSAIPSSVPPAPVSSPTIPQNSNK